MSRFKIPLRRKYKTGTSWLDAVYKQNRSIIDAQMVDPKTMNPEDRLSRKQQFIDLVKEQMENEHLRMALDKDRVGIRDAVEHISRTRKFTSYAEQARINVREALRGSEAERQLKENLGTDRLITNKFVWTETVDAQKKEIKGYKYGNYLITFENSPKGGTGGKFTITEI